MLKKLPTALVFSFLLILSSMFVLINTANYASAATTIQVPSANYPTIQSALNAATNGTVINVASGTYNENIICSYTYTWNNHTSITLQGSKDTIINGNVLLNGFTGLQMDNFVITGTLSIGNSMEGLVQSSTFINIQAPTITFYSMYSTFSHLTVSSSISISGAFNTVSYSNLNVVNFGKNVRGTGYSVGENNIAYNTISGGINCPQAIDTKIFGNTMSGAKVGISETPYIVSSSGGGGLTVFDNTITNNDVGISLLCSQYYHGIANITKNTISNNGVGVEIQVGINPTAANTLYLNDFVNNGIQVNASQIAPNIWSSGNPMRGNYWSDYKGVDNNNDGIGDTPYIINANNTDNYPIVRSSPQPTPTPTPSPSSLPDPSAAPTATPTPTADPTPTPTTSPTAQPTQAPTTQPTATASPTSNPASNSNSDPSPSATPTIPEINPAFIIILIAVLSISIMGTKHLSNTNKKQLKH